jgi:hypothetical protein
MATRGRFCGDGMVVVEAGVFLPIAKTDVKRRGRKRVRHYFSSLISDQHHFQECPS